MEYRNELKFLCSEQDIQILKARLEPFMKQDIHQNEADSYQIRSVYFDDYEDHGLRENEAGVDLRKKFRIRIYNCSKEMIRLEVKYKIHGKTKKESCQLSLEEYRAIMAGDIDDIFWKKKSKVFHMFYLAVRTEYLQPKIIVEYERSAFVHEAGNVRITFDRNIASSDDMEHFFEKDMLTIPVMETGKHIVEVKYDEFLPDYILNVMQLPHIQQTAFSKYYWCRKVSHLGV